MAFYKMTPLKKLYLNNKFCFVLTLLQPLRRHNPNYALALHSSGFTIACKAKTQIQTVYYIPILFSTLKRKNKYFIA